MIDTQKKLQQLLDKGFEYFSKTSELKLSEKPSLSQWSKKELLGHLIDSGINNLQRFTEIQFKPKPYQLINYNQNELVIANNYQQANTKNILAFWIAINTRIISVIAAQTETTLSYAIELDKQTADLRFLIIDYVDHLKHHLNQIEN